MGACASAPITSDLYCPTFSLQGAAASMKNIDKVTKEGGINSRIDSEGNTLLHSAVVQNDCWQVEHCMHLKGINPNLVNNRGEAPFHLAARRGFYRNLLILIREQQDVRFAVDYDLKDSAGFTLYQILENKLVTCSIEERKLLEDLLYKVKSLKSVKSVIENSDMETLQNMAKIYRDCAETRMLQNERICKIEKMAGSSC
jgi:ankyrin repeat protein